MDAFERRENITLINNGQKIFGIIHRPLTLEKVPAVLICHGLAGQKIGAHRMYVTLSEHLVKLGIASLRFDFRGSGDSEGEFAEMTLKGEISDAFSALDFLIDDPFIDTNRLGFFGRSFGGAIATKSVALWAPIFNAVQWEKQWEKVQTATMDAQERHDLMRIDGQMPSMEFYGELFQMNLLEHIHKLQHVPFLHIQGEKDPIVDISHANQYIEARKIASSESKFIRLEHSDHDFSHPEEKKQSIIDTSNWFLRTLCSQSELRYPPTKKFGEYPRTRRAQ
jgi:uncharacterized protein